MSKPLSRGTAWVLFGLIGGAWVLYPKNVVLLVALVGGAVWYHADDIRQLAGRFRE